MKFCIENNERQGTCYFEFQKGKFRNKYWIENNLCLSADIFEELKLYDLFSKVIQFDYFGPNELTEKQWLQIKSESEKIGGNVKEVITEIDIWVNTVLPKEPIILLGI